jgi:hypothetical protein
MNHQTDRRLFLRFEEPIKNHWMIAQRTNHTSPLPILHWTSTSDKSQKCEMKTKVSKAPARVLATMNVLIACGCVVVGLTSSPPPGVLAWTASPLLAWTRHHAVSVDTNTHVESYNHRRGKTDSALFMSSEQKAPRHDVGGNPLDQLEPDQRERVQAFMTYQQSLPKIGFPTDVRSLVQYNHGFAVMSTISKS